MVLKSIEKTGKWQGLPSRLELRLLICLSSNLPKEELENIMDKINRFI